MVRARGHLSTAALLLRGGGQAHPSGSRPRAEGREMTDSQHIFFLASLLEYNCFTMVC